MGLFVWKATCVNSLIARPFCRSSSAMSVCRGKVSPTFARQNPITALQARAVPFSSIAAWRFNSSMTSESNGTQRPFKILGVQQIAIGCIERDPLHRLWIDVFGLQVEHGGITIASENVVEDILKVGLGDFAVEIDLMTPIDPEKSPKVHIPPLNHVGLWVDNLEHAVEWMTSKGVRFTPGGIRIGAAGHAVAFVHPKSNEANPISGNGVLIELVQAPATVIQTLTDK